MDDAIHTTGLILMLLALTLTILTVPALRTLASTIVTLTLKLLLISRYAMHMVGHVNRDCVQQI